jgi:hypothetical protein
MSDKNEMIKQFAADHNLSESEAILVYGTGEPDEIARNYSLLEEIKGGQSGDQGNQTRQTDLERQANDLFARAEEALKAGDTAKSISLRRQAYGIQVKK